MTPQSIERQARALVAAATQAGLHVGAAMDFRALFRCEGTGSAVAMVIHLCISRERCVNVRSYLEFSHRDSKVSRRTPNCCQHTLNLILPPIQRALIPFESSSEADRIGVNGFDEPTGHRQTDRGAIRQGRKLNKDVRVHAKPGAAGVMDDAIDHLSLFGSAHQVRPPSCRIMELARNTKPVKVRGRRHQSPAQPGGNKCRAIGLVPASPATFSKRNPQCDDSSSSCRDRTQPLRSPRRGDRATKRQSNKQTNDSRHGECHQLGYHLATPPAANHRNHLHRDTRLKYRGNQHSRVSACA